MTKPEFCDYLIQALKEKGITRKYFKGHPDLNIFKNLVHTANGGTGREPSDAAFKRFADMVGIRFEVNTDYKILKAAGIEIEIKNQ